MTGRTPSAASAPAEAAAGLSVCILACNEEDVLGRCLESVAWADEIVVVVDAKSRDGSEKIAREMASRVEVRPYAGDIAQKSFAASLGSHDWILIVDPDEVVPPALGREIRTFLASSAQRPEIGGCELDRITFHLGRWLRHGDFHPDWKLRLYRAARGRWEGRDPHGRVAVDGEVPRLDTALEHYSYRDLADQVDRIQFFSAQAAASMHAEGCRFRLVDLVLRPPARFLRAYVLKRGFLDGIPGFVVAAATAFHVFLKYAKLWEIERKPGASDSTSGSS
jgi:glycosyltransferase involved in cell wall biosynthesis